MIVLAIDTALKACSVAILRDGEGVFDKFDLLEKGHAEILPLMVARGLDAAAVRPDQIDRIAVTIGPGGFTGVRVGLAFARGFAVGRGPTATPSPLSDKGSTGDRRQPQTPIIGIDTLTGLFHSFSNRENDLPTAVIADARRGEVFGALFDERGETLLKPFAAPPETVSAQLVHSLNGRRANLIDPDGFFSDRFSPDDSYKETSSVNDNWQRLPSKPGVMPLILAALGADKNPADYPPTPLYLRSPDAKPAKATALDLFSGLT
ncbi:MAG: tRNA (adenosine(37)-N6)-threonylcarbamoyltransferase complex dimerization subunit type 1 TsaB [Pseudomonadota bacterium]